MGIEDKIFKLQQQKARLVRKEQALKALERKQETKRFINLGKLLASYGLDQMEEKCLAGALQEVRELSQEQDTLSRWRDKAKLSTENTQKEIPLIVKFATPPSKETAAFLKENNLKWNPFRHEWQGYALLPKITSALKESGAEIVTCDS